MTLSLLIAQAEWSPTHYFRMSLAELGHSVETAIGGLECLKKLRQHKPDLLILEQDLPWGGGDGVLARMREEATELTVPVVLVVDRPEMSSELTESPVVCLLRKPFRLMELLDCLQWAAGKKGRPGLIHAGALGASANQSFSPRKKTQPC
jgi:CheY-like chemotaxis protein